MNSHNAHHATAAPGHWIHKLAARVRKPSRYIGGEINAVRKDDAEVRVALVFPDVYDVGMSHLGLKILYSIINALPYASAERCFCPWPDMEACLRETGEPLRSLETGRPLKEFDVVGFSLQYELCATGVLQALDLGGIPLKSSQRGDVDPLVLGGGPVASNPAPLSTFFDAFALGDGEDLVVDIVGAVLDRKRSRSGRQALLEGLTKIAGVYVPALHRRTDRVRRRIVADLDHAPFPKAQVVPYCEPIHDRISVEIARGCTRGCRFCQAGFLYRPVRERSLGNLMELAEHNVRTTGWEEISLLSLSAGDHSQIGPIVRAFANRFSTDKTALSLPSMRTESLDPCIAEEIKRVRKTGFTLAPEAGTDRLRRVINKGNDEADLERAVKAAFSAGWQTLKLYFMIGLPTETEEDVLAVADLIRKAARWAAKGRLTVSVSTFVPKPHTPFQWAAQDLPERVLQKQRLISDRLRPTRVKARYHDFRQSFLEGALARGDERVGEVILEAYQRGARFDGWNELMNFDLWMESFRAVGLDPHTLLRERDTSEELPWGMVDVGVTDQFLREEWEKALHELFTPDCRVEGCRSCGVCDFTEVRPVAASSPAPYVLEPGPDTPTPAPTNAETKRFRMCYTKRGAMRFLGHRDVMRAVHRAFRRSGLKLDYSHGFHPHPRLIFSPPPPVGVESYAEYLDFDLLSFSGEPADVFAALGKTMPPGLDPVEITAPRPPFSPLSKALKGFCYEVRISAPPESIRLGGDRLKAEAPETGQEAQEAGHKALGPAHDWTKYVEKNYIADNILYFTLRWDQTGSLNPLDAAAAILEVEKETIKEMKVVKVRAIMEE